MCCMCVWQMDFHSIRFDIENCYRKWNEKCGRCLPGFPHFHALHSLHSFSFAFLSVLVAFSFSFFLLANRFKCFMANGQKIYCRQFADVPPSGWKRWVACGSGCVWGPVARIRNGNHSGNTQISSDFSSPISFAFSKKQRWRGRARARAHESCMGHKQNKTLCFSSSSCSGCCSFSSSTSLNFPQLHLLEKRHKSKHQSKYVFLCQFTSKG